MSPTLKSLGIDRLTVDERIVLAQEIWDSIPEESHPLSLTEAQTRELDRRLADLDANPDAGIPWEEVKADIDSRLGR